MDSTILQQLATEVGAVLNEDPDIYFVKSVSSKTQNVSIHAAGKFVSRIDWVRKCLVEDGFIVQNRSNVITTVSDGIFSFSLHENLI